MAEHLLLALFTLNIILVLVDASLGYHIAPKLIIAAPKDEENNPDTFVRGIRRMLTGVVTLYMFFNCLAYFRQDSSLMAVVTALIVLDLVGQLYVSNRAKRDRGDTT